MSASILVGRLPLPLRTDDRALRTSRLTPYLKGRGPVFSLRLYDSCRCERSGHHYISFELSITEHGVRETFSFIEWIGLPPGCAIDSIEALKECWRSVGMKPGDTDDAFFDDYPPRLLAIVTEHGESIDCAVLDRFGE